jgi:lipopolysaccharide biosynthesis glycosyltransferase
MMPKNIGCILKNQGVVFMDIAFGIDDGYTMPCGVLITSILRTNPNIKINFHVLSEDLSEKNKTLLRGVICNSNCTIAFYSVQDSDTLKNAYVPGHWGIATLYRLFIPLLLPETISKVLYLDSDMLVVDSLDPLWNTDIENYPVIVTDPSIDDIRHFNRLGYNYTDGYYNVAILIINMDYWRKNNITEKTFSFLHDNKERCLYPDMDAINYVLAGKMKRVSARFDAFIWIDVTEYLTRSEFHADMRDAQINPAVIHFIGPVKPWYKECSHPYRDVWLFVKNQTVWKPVRLVRRLNIFKSTVYSLWVFTRKYKINKKIRRIFEILHLIDKKKPEPFLANLAPIYERLQNG